MKKVTLQLKTISIFCLTLLTGSLMARNLTVASCNGLHQAHYYRNAKGNRIPLNNRTKLFYNSIASGDLSNADIIGFQEWPNKNKEGVQSRDWNKILENTGRKIFTSKNNSPYVTDVVTIACNPSNDYTIRPYYYQDGSPLVPECYKKMPSLRPEQFLGTRRGDAIAVVLTFKSPNKKVGIINVHLEGGCPQGWNGRYHDFRIWQLKKVIEFQELIELKENSTNMSWIIMGDFNWNFNGNIKNHETCLRGMVFKRSDGWIDADPQAENKKMHITTCRITPDGKFTHNEFCRMDYMFYKNIKQKVSSVKAATQKKEPFVLSILYSFFGKQQPQTYQKSSYNLYPKFRIGLIPHENKTPQTSTHFSDHAIVTSKFTV